MVFELRKKLKKCFLQTTSCDYFDSLLALSSQVRENISKRFYFKVVKISMFYSGYSYYRL
jgi:hypothetical protein